MTSTTFREPLTGRMLANMATGYRLIDGRFAAQPYEFVSPVLPAGSSAATAPDMARFMMALLNGGALGKVRILKPSSVKMLFSDSFSNSPSLQGMAHGFYVIQKAGPRIVGHGGNTGDFHSNFVVVPEKGFGFFISETGGRGSSDGRTELTEAMIGRVFPQPPAPFWTGADTVKPLVGSYRGNRRDYGRPAMPKYDFKLTMPDANHILLDGPEGKSAWEHIGPNLYQQVTSLRAGGPYRRMEFYGTPDNLRFSFSFEPYENYHFVKPE
jgi:CubicO group peptidase (beta-lactamase class C family)